MIKNYFSRYKVLSYYILDVFKNEGKKTLLRWVKCGVRARANRRKFEPAEHDDGGEGRGVIESERTDQEGVCYWGLPKII